MTDHIPDASKMVESPSQIAGKADEMPEWVNEEVHAARAQELRSKGRTYRDGSAAIVWFADDRERLLARTTWQPISTAPKDGRAILLYRFVDPWSVVGWGKWAGVGAISGWISHGFNDPPGELGLAHPTHWMPLPAPPTEDTNASR